MDGTKIWFKKIIHLKKIHAVTGILPVTMIDLTAGSPGKDRTLRCIFRLFEFKVVGADVFRNAVKIIRPTYVGFHGYLGEWLTDNPEFTKEILNMCGYWYFPKSINVTQKNSKTLSFEMEWINKGVAPAYTAHQLRGKLIPKDKTAQSIDFVVEDSGNKKWMPGVVSTEKYTITLSGKPKGEYSLAIQLFDTRCDKPVEIGLSKDIKVEDYFNVQILTIF